MQITPGVLKNHLANNQWLPLSSDSDSQRLADKIACWFDDHARALSPLDQIDLLRGFTYDQGFDFKNGSHADKLRWLIALVGRLVRRDSLVDTGWPPPIQFRVKSLLGGNEDRLGDYVLLYEAFVHLHFVAVASQFFWMTRDLEVADLPSSVAVGHKILVAALTDKKCMGGGVWLQRAGGISRAGHDLIKSSNGACVASLPELFDLLEPETLVLHQAFGTNPHQAEIVRASGPTFRLFKLLQQVRNTLVAHDEELGGHVDAAVVDGLLAIFGVVGQRLARYQQLGLALTNHAERQLVLKAQWNSAGDLRLPQNRAARDHFISIWGKPPESEAPFAAPDVPSIEGWSWEDSLLLFDRAAPRTRYLYLMPMGCRYENADGSGELLPGLLDSVIWRKIGGTRRTSLTIVQRKYRNKSELASDWHDTQSHQPVRPGPAHDNIRTLVEKIRAAYPLDFELPEEETEAVARVFDLGHGPHALRLAEATVPRAGEVERILGRARELAARDTVGCARLLLMGPSGIGKSVLMAQMYARVQPRALFFTMDHAPEPEFELAPASRGAAPSPAARSGDSVSSIQPPSPSLGGEGRERGLGVPVRMHWLAGAQRLAGKPAPTSMLDAEKVQRQIAALLEEASAAASEPIYLFVDAVNQTAAPESLLQGFRPFSRLPGNVVIIASTQDNAEVLARLTDNGRQPWESFPAEALVLEQTRSVFLWNWPSGSPPSPSDGLIGFVQSQSGGLPLLARFWGERFAALWQDNPTTAESRLRAELAQGGAALLPRNYFDDRLDKASRDFVPARLPEALLWCFSLISKPLGTDGLTRAIARVRGHFELPPISKANVDGAIARLSGLLVADHFGFDRLWRLAHPIIGAAYLDYFGTPDRIAEINETLLPFGAMPQVEAWNADQRIAWLERLFGRATEYSELETEQKRALVTGLLAQLESDSRLQGWRHRRGYLMAEHGWLLHQLKRSDEGFALAEQALAWGRERLPDPELSAALRADLQWDLGSAIRVMGIIEWSRGLRVPVVARFEEVLALCEGARSYTPGWTDDRERGLAVSHRNLALSLNIIGQRDEAIRHCESAIHILERLDLADARVRAELAGAYFDQGWVRDTLLVQREAALADYDRAIELCEGLDLGNPDYRDRLASAHHNRGITRDTLDQREAALADYDRAIELREGLDLGNPDYRNRLASAHHGRGNARDALGQWEAALADYDRAIELQPELISVQSQAALRWAAQRLKSLSHGSILEDEAALSVTFTYEERLAPPGFRPLCPGPWELLPPSQGESVVRDLCLVLKWLHEQSALNWIRGSRVGLRQLALSSHCGWSINELVVVAPDRAGAIAFLRGPDGIFPLGGEGAPFHCMNLLQKPDFSDNDKLLAYARIFCHGVRGEEGRFLWITHPDELPWSNGVDEETRKAIASKIQPPETVRSEDLEVLINVAYSNMLFHSRLHVTRKGYIEMLEDQPVASNLRLMGWSALLL